MAEFEVKVVKIDDVIDHPNADRLTIVKIGGYNCIANKKEDGSWRYHAGDLVVYIPEQAVVPEWLLKHMGFWNDEKGQGGLAGSKGDRVKAIKLRGTFSQGILMPVITDYPNGIPYGVCCVRGSNQEQFCNVGTDVSELLGIQKYEPPIPTQMAGEVWNALGMTLNFDVENIQKYPDILQEGEEVQATEKLHGTWCCYGFYPKDDGTGIKIVSSKGLSSRGLAFKFTDENCAKNLYLQTLERTRDEEGFDLLERLINHCRQEDEKFHHNQEPIYLLGEVFGTGVQDLKYGEMKPAFRLFDVYVGQPGQGRYMNVDEKIQLAKTLNVVMVPELYRGPFNMAKMEELRDGMDFSGSNIREGIVIVPVKERRNDEIGRVQLKFVSPAYSLRKGGTELN